MNTWLVAEVHSWHHLRGNLRKTAKTSTIHSRHTSLDEARKTRASLNSGHKLQRYWVLDWAGRVTT